MGLLFGEKLERTVNGFRTNYVMPIFEQNALKASKLEIEKVAGLPTISANSPVGTRDGTRTCTTVKVKGF